MGIWIGMGQDLHRDLDRDLERDLDRDLARDLDRVLHRNLDKDVDEILHHSHWPCVHANRKTCHREKSMPACVFRSQSNLPPNIPATHLIQNDLQPK